MFNLKKGAQYLEVGSLWLVKLVDVLQLFLNRLSMLDFEEIDQITLCVVIM
jgi:hypothetical protein